MSSKSPPGPDGPSTSKSLTCGQCNMTFDTTQELAEHNRRAYNGVKYTKINHRTC